MSTRLAVLAAVLGALVAGCGNQATSATCQVMPSSIATGESNGMGGFRLAFQCPDLVVRQVSCTSTVAGNPSSAAMTCECSASGAAARSFPLPNRSQLLFDSSSIPFVNANCGWTMPVAPSP